MQVWDGKLFHIFPVDWLMVGTLSQSEALINLLFHLNVAPLGVNNCDDVVVRTMRRRKCWETFVFFFCLLWRRFPVMISYPMLGSFVWKTNLKNEAKRNGVVCLRKVCFRMNGCRYVKRREYSRSTKIGLLSYLMLHDDHIWEIHLVRIEVSHSLFIFFQLQWWNVTNIYIIK